MTITRQVLVNAVTGEVEIGPKNYLYDYATYRELMVELSNHE